MRPILFSRKFSLFLFLVIFLYPACSSNFTGNKRVIIVTAGNTTNDSLTLKDEQGNPAFEFNVQPGDKIDWELNDPSGTVTDFTAFPLETNHTPVGVLEDRPHKKVFSKTWTGKVKQSAHNGQDEYYSIKWNGNDGKGHTFDPRIIVNP